MKPRLVAWAVLLIVLAGALVVGVVDRDGRATEEERASDIGETIGCPECAGQTVADSDAASARNIRSVIREMVDEGLSDDEIRAEVDARYPENLLLTPRRSGIVGLVWVAPVVALVLALAGLGYAFYRWRGVARGGSASPADRALVEQAAVARETERQGAPSPTADHALAGDTKDNQAD